MHVHRGKIMLAGQKECHAPVPDQRKALTVGIVYGVDLVDTHRLRTWDRPNFSEPDVLDVWPQWEVTDIFSTPYYTVRTDLSPDDPAAYQTGLATLDLETDEFVTIDFEDTAVIIFSSVINPVRPAEVYGVYTTLSKIDREKGELLDRIDLDHTYYAVNVASDGSELYLGGTMDDIAVYDTETFEKIGRIEVPDGADQALASLEGGADESSLRVVRNYRERPSPLVRDSVKQWRTGKLDRVLAGDFDVIG